MGEKKTLNWKTKTLIIGGVFGVISGLLAAYLVVRRAEDNQDQAKLSPAEGIQLGLGLLGLMRLIAK
jgi:hypothetical protein